MYVINWWFFLNFILYSGWMYFYYYEIKSGVWLCFLDYKNSIIIIEFYKVKIWYLIKENLILIILIKFLFWFWLWWLNRCLLILFILLYGLFLLYRLIRNDFCLIWFIYCLNWFLIIDYYLMEVDCEKIV